MITTDSHREPMITDPRDHDLAASSGGDHDPQVMITAILGGGRPTETLEEVLQAMIAA
jgi:hypothetical protein